MTQNDEGKPGAPDTDILSAIRRIVDEEQSGAAPAAEPAAAPPAPAAARGAALVLTPTMRVNAADDDTDDAPPLRLTKRVDAGARDDAGPGRSLRNAFGRDGAEAAGEPLRLQPAARVDEAAASEAVAAAPQPEPEPEVAPTRLSGFAGQKPEAEPEPEAAPVAAQEPEAAPEPEASQIPAAPAATDPIPEAAPAEAAPAVAAGMTREELETLITEKLRQDLSGELGTRISANIRTLVQREVAAAVAALSKRQP